MKRLDHGRRAAALSAVAALLLAVPPVAAQTNASASKSASVATAKKAHRMILQVNTNDPALMNLALNNATNVEQYYKELGGRMEIKLSAFGPGQTELPYY